MSGGHAQQLFDLLRPAVGTFGRFIGADQGFELAGACGAAVFEQRHGGFQAATKGCVRVIQSNRFDGRKGLVSQVESALRVQPDVRAFRIALDGRRVDGQNLMWRHQRSPHDG